MTTIVQPTKESKLANALLASGGDVALVAEHYNRRHEVDDHISPTEILEAFLVEVTNNIQVQDNVRAMLLLNFLQLLTDVKQQMSQALPDFSSSDLIKTVQLIVEGVSKLLPQQAVDAQPNVNIWQQFGGDQARERVQQRIETYRKLDEAYVQPTSTES